MNFTDPGSRSFTCVSTRAVASRIATCVSCPHACMTPTLLPSYSPVALLANGRFGFFAHRQPVHVGAQRDDRARPAAAQQRDDAGLRDAGLRLEAETPQPVGDVAAPFRFRDSRARDSDGGAAATESARARPRRSASRRPWPAIAMPSPPAAAGASPSRPFHGKFVRASSASRTGLSITRRTRPRRRARGHGEEQR